MKLPSNRLEFKKYLPLKGVYCINDFDFKDTDEKANKITYVTPVYMLLNFALLTSIHPRYSSF
jgi:hypothetical protein